MNSPRARGLRSRLSINPDEEPPPPAAAIAVPEPVAPAELNAAEDQPPPVDVPETARAPRKKAKASPAARVSAVDDPKIVAGRKDYRSFYIEDTTFARFRAAVYWLSRHPEASAEVGENMSVAMERWMRDTANDLERRYNHDEVFPMPPVKERRKRV